MKTNLTKLIILFATPWLLSCSSKILNPLTATNYNKPIHKAVALSDVQINKSIIPNQIYQPFVASFCRSIEQGYLDCNLIENLTLEREMTSKGIGSEAYLIRYRIIDFTTAQKWGFYKIKETDSFVVEMFVYDVSNASIEKIKSTDYDNLINTYNTTDLTPIFRSKYEISVKSVVRATRKPEKAIAFSRKLANNLAIELIDKSHKDIVKAINK